MDRNHGLERCGGRRGQCFCGRGRAALAGGRLRGGGAQRLGRVREEGRDVRGQPWEAGHGCGRGFDRHRDGGHRLAAVAEGLERHPVGRVVAGGHGDGGRGVHHPRAVHVRPRRGELAVQRVPGGGEGRQPAGHFVLSGDDVLDGERVLEAGRRRAQVVPGRHLREMRGGVEGAQSQLGLLLEVLGGVLWLGGGQRVLDQCAAHLEALPAPQKAPVLEHVSAVGMQRPEAALPGLVRPPGDFDEAVVEGKVVAQRVLPPLRVLPVVREPVHDELVDLAEGEHLLRAALDGHGRQGDVGVRRLLVAVRVPARAGHGSAGADRTEPGPDRLSLTVQSRFGLFKLPLNSPDSSHNLYAPAGACRVARMVLWNFGAKVGGKLQVRPLPARQGASSGGCRLLHLLLWSAVAPCARWTAATGAEQTHPRREVPSINGTLFLRHMIIGGGGTGSGGAQGRAEPTAVSHFQAACALRRGAFLRTECVSLCV